MDKDLPLESSGFMHFHTQSSVFSSFSYTKWCARRGIQALLEDSGKHLCLNHIIGTFRMTITPFSALSPVKRWYDIRNRHLIGVFANLNLSIFGCHKLISVLSTLQLACEGTFTVLALIFNSRWKSAIVQCVDPCPFTGYYYVSHFHTTLPHVVYFTVLAPASIV